MMMNIKAGKMQIRYTGKPMPFGLFQEACNTAYYSLVGSESMPFLAFTTYVEGDDKTAKANAIEAARRFKKGRINVLEQGVGHGRFARDFLGHMKRLGRADDVQYFALDVAESLLDRLRKSFPPGRITTLTQNAEDPIALGQNIHVAQFNEVWDDLKTSHYLIRSGEAYEIMASPRMYGGDECYRSGTKDLVGILKGIFPHELGVAGFSYKISFRKARAKDFPKGKHRELILDYLSDLSRSSKGERLHIPINLGALRNIENLMEVLDRRGFIDTNDYGFCSMDDMVQKDGVMLAIGQNFGGQITSPVNFHFLSYAMSGHKIHVELQRDYISRVLGRRFIELDAVASKFDSKEIFSKFHDSQTRSRIVRLLNKANGTVYGDSLGQFIPVEEISRAIPELAENRFEIDEKSLHRYRGNMHMRICRR